MITRSSFVAMKMAPDTDAGSAILDEALGAVGGFGNDGATPADDVDVPEFADDTPDDAAPPADPSLEDLDQALDAGNPDVEEIEVTVAGGEKLKVKIDYKDREAIKRAFQKNAGIDKLHGAWKSLKTENSSIKEQLAAQTADLGVLKSIEALHGEGTPAELEKLFEYLARDDKAGVDHTYTVAKAIVDKHDRVKSMTPEQRAQWDRERAIEERLAAGEAARAELAKVNERISAVESQGLIERAQAAVDTVFPEFSFVGKIADNKAAQELDDFMFRGLQSRLAEVKQQGHVVTPELVRTLLKTFASSIPAAIHKEAQEHAKRSKTASSTAAKRAVQNAALRTSGPSSKGSNASANRNWADQSANADLLFRELNR